MPIYEYRCAACGHTLEALQKLADKPLKECPECSKSSLQRLVSAPSFRLKGGGWYETDFKTGGKKNVAGSEGKESSGASESKSAGSSSGTAAKKENAGT